MHNLQNSNEPRSREIYAEPIYAFERGGSEVQFDTKTFTCVYVNFCSIGIIIQPILCENYEVSSIKIEVFLKNNKTTTQYKMSKLEQNKAKLSPFDSRYPKKIF